MMRLVVAATLAATCLPGARAWYVAPGGRDEPSGGSRQAPLGSVAVALARLRPGDLLVLLPGRYTEPIVINRSGTPENFLHIVAANPPYATPAGFPHDGSSVIDAAGRATAPAVLLDGCAHVRLAGLRVINSRAPAAVELRDTRDCVVEYVFVEQSSGVGLKVTGRGNTLYECQVSGGAGGYEFAGSLTDLRWCASLSNAIGFRATGPVAGLLLLQNRHVAGGRVGFELTSGGSDITLNGNWADGAAEWGFRAAGRRLILLNNTADHTGNGIQISGGADVSLFNNSVLSAAGRGLLLEREVQTALVLNNILQSEAENIVVEPQTVGASIWLDYNLYTRASFPFRFHGRANRTASDDLPAWRAATGFDRNSRLAPLVYWKSCDRNGRWRVRPVAVAVSSLTHDFEVGPPGINAYPHTGGGTLVLDLPQNWKPWGDPERRVYVFAHEPAAALAARMCWYAARADYRTADGRRVQKELYRFYGPPELIPAGAFCQDDQQALVYVRLPADAVDPCPIGQRIKLPPDRAVGYYLPRTATGPAQKHQGKLVDAALAQTLAQAGVTEVEVVPNVLHCLGGTPMLEKGCPILGHWRDADSMARPAVSGSMAGFGWHPGPGRYDVGASECGYWVP